MDQNDSGSGFGRESDRHVGSPLSAPVAELQQLPPIHSNRPRHEQWVCCTDPEQHNFVGVEIQTLAIHSVTDIQSSWAWVVRALLLVMGMRAAVDMQAGLVRTARPEVDIHHFREVHTLRPEVDIRADGMSRLMHIQEVVHFQELYNFLGRPHRAGRRSQEQQSWVERTGISFFSVHDSPGKLHIQNNSSTCSNPHRNVCLRDQRNSFVNECSHESKADLGDNNNDNTCNSRHQVIPPNSLQMELPYTRNISPQSSFRNPHNSHKALLDNLPSLDLRAYGDG
jgi:hypothetical protein